MKKVTTVYNQQVSTPLAVDVQYFNWKLLEPAAPIPTGKRGKVVKAWLCECQCEKKTRRIVRQRSTHALASKGCGCGHTVAVARANINRPYLLKKGDVFGRLTVQSIANVDKAGRHWECTCSCGNVVVVAQSTLRFGATKSCGCIRKEMLAERNMNNRKHALPVVGDVFERLTVTRLLDTETPTKVECRCECGNYVVLSTKAFVAHGTRSCGCLRNDRVREAVGIPGGSRAAEYRRAADKRRSDRERQASPPWQKTPTAAYALFVKAAAQTSIATGTKHAADHIVPLVGKEKRLHVVCGLHCKDNFQILPHKTNAKKSNQAWPDKPNYSESDLEELKNLHKKTCYNKR